MGKHPEGDADVLRWVEELRRGVDVETHSRRLFRRYYGWVRGFFERRGIAFQQAEDLAQDTFFQVFREIRSFRGDGTFQSWLFAVAANVFRNERRRLSREKRDAPEIPLEPGDPETGGGIDVADDAASPEQVAFDNERLEALGRAVAELPEQQRACLELRLAGRDPPEIADLLKLSPSTVRVHAFNARRRLQEVLGEEYAKWID